EAIKEALLRNEQPMRVQEIYKRIIEDDLYRFNAANPEHIVRTQLRRHSDNLDFPTAHKTKHFVFLKDGTYWLKDKTYEINIGFVDKISDKTDTANEVIYNGIKDLHSQYNVGFKKSLLIQLTKLEPYSFEEFCKRLLQVYGFKNVKVT